MALQGFEGRPAKGRFFPLTFSQVVGAVNAAGLLTEDGQRIAIRLVNPDSREASELTLIEFRPRKELVLYSLAEHADPAAARALLEQAISGCRTLSRRPQGESRDIAQVFLFRMGTPGASLRVLQRRSYYQREKYRVTQKFSSAFKARLIREEEREVVLAPVTLDHG